MDKIKRKALQRELKAVEDAYAGTLGWLELGELRSWVEAGNSPYFHSDPFRKRYPCAINLHRGIFSSE